MTLSQKLFFSRIIVVIAVIVVTTAVSTKKTQIQTYRQHTLLHIGTSFASVVFGVTAMNPVDVVRTRLYNQQSSAGSGGDLKYRSGVDAAYKIARYEGPGAFFKGWGAHYLRGAPHVALIFVLLEQLKKRRPLEKV